MMFSSHERANGGYSLIEVLVTLIITMLGLLGIAGLQAKAQVAGFESYQRAQALVILSGITDRMNINRETVSCFAFTTNTTNGTPYLGAAGVNHISTPSCAASTSSYNTLADAAINEIDGVLEGSAESMAGSSVGAMIDARACISYDPSSEVAGKPGTGLYTVIVTWQGMSNLVAPVDKSCAVGEYGTGGMRRAVSSSFRLASLI